MKTLQRTEQKSTRSTLPCNEGWPSNPLEGVQLAFDWLTTGPDPVTVNGILFDCLPDRDIPVDELRELLLAPECPHTLWDAVWAHLILRARLEGQRWTVVCVGLALPVLRKMAWELTRDCRHDPDDIHAEILRGFLNRLALIELDQGRIMIRLRWAAYRAGRAALTNRMRGPTPRPLGFTSAMPQPPFGHPDLVLVRAVTDGVLTQSEAALIGATRLEEVTLSEWATVHDLTYGQVQRARHRAEQRLAIWLDHASEPDGSDDPTTSEATTRLALTTCSHRHDRSRRVTKKVRRPRSDRHGRCGLSGRGGGLSSTISGDRQAVTSCA